jgi:hypothetical protein
MMQSRWRPAHARLSELRLDHGISEVPVGYQAHFTQNPLRESMSDMEMFQQSSARSLSSCTHQRNQNGPHYRTMNDPSASLIQFLGVRFTNSCRLSPDDLHRQSHARDSSVTKLASRPVTRHPDVGQSPSLRGTGNRRPTRLLPLLRPRVLPRLLNPMPSRRR